MESLKQCLQNAQNEISVELEPYLKWATDYLDLYHKQVVQNLSDLDLEQESTLPDILSVTQELTRSFFLFNQNWVSPVLRTRSSDRLSLTILRWLHSTIPETEHIPVALRDGAVSVLPVANLPTIYAMPCSIQYGLLYLALFFHEQGHLLYVCHKPEMDDRVRDLQETISEMLEPKVQRNDHYAEEDAKKRSIIVEKWYEWTQEVFCDAVGFVVGGPAFLYAFSFFLRMRGKDQYHLSYDEQAVQNHPIAWLRIRLLVDRLKREGLNSEGEQVEEEWLKIAEAMKLSEDYYGFYEEYLLPEIQEAIDDMLSIAEPRKFRKNEISVSNENVQFLSPIHLLNRAWQQFLNDPDSYSNWEKNAIRNFLEAQERRDKPM